MDQIKKILKQMSFSSIITSILVGILGLILIINPYGSLKLVSIFLGGILMLAGIYKLIIYFINKSQNSMYNSEMITGIITAIIGLIIIIFCKELEAVFRIFIGIIIIYNAIMKINMALQFKNINSSIWMVSLIISIITLIAGIYVLFMPNALIVTIGIILLITAIMDVIDKTVLIHKMNKFTK